MEIKGTVPGEGSNTGLLRLAGSACNPAVCGYISAGKRGQTPKFTMKIHVVALISFTLGVLLIVFVLYTMTGKALIAPRLTYNSLKKVALGMSPQEVVAVLGAPIDIAFNDFAESYLIQLPSGTKEETYAPGRIMIYTYAQPRWGNVVRSQPALWIRFLDGKVSEVYAKEYCMYNDAVMFVVSPDNNYENPHVREMFDR